MDGSGSLKMGPRTIRALLQSSRTVRDLLQSSPPQIASPAFCDREAQHQSCFGKHGGNLGASQAFAIDDQNREANCQKVENSVFPCGHSKACN